MSHSTCSQKLTENENKYLLDFIFYLNRRWSDYGLCYNNLDDFDEQHRHHMETAVPYETETFTTDMHLYYQVKQRVKDSFGNEK
jgi:hypothetical protein